MQIPIQLERVPLLLVLLLFAGNGYSQKADSMRTVPARFEDFIFGNPVDEAEFPGGRKALLKYLADTMKYPQAAVEAKIEGKVFTSFVIQSDGCINHIGVLKGLGYGLDEEAKRLVARMPCWIPGKINGKPWAVKYNLPIVFKLDEQPTANPH